MSFCKWKWIAAALCAANLLPLSAAGPFPAENAAWSESELAVQRRAGAALQADLKKAVAEGKKSFQAKKGVYRFTETEGKRPFFLNFINAKDFTFDGGGSQFYFEKDATAIQVYKSSNVKIRNLVLDYDPLPFSQGEVVSVDYRKNTFIFRPEKGYGAFCAPLFRKSLRGMLFAKKDRRMKIGQTGFSLILQKKLENGDYQVLVRGFYNRPAKDCGFEKGDLIAVWARTSRAVKIEVSEKVALENVTLYSSPFVAFVENVGRGGHSYKNCRLVKRPGTNRLIAGNADGFNSACVLKGPRLENCEIDTIGDDFINFHGVYYRVFEQVSPDELIVQGFQANGEKNPVLSFLENKSWKFLGSRKAVESKAVRYVIPESSSSVRHSWAAAGNFKPGQKIQAVRVRLDKPLMLKEAAIFSCRSAIAADAEIRNCTFRNSLARGIRFQSCGAVIENNTLDRAQGPHLTTAGQPGYWGESVTSSSLIVRGNTFLEGNMDSQSRFVSTIEITAPGPAGAAETAENIVLEHNRILKSGGAAIQVRNARNIQVKNNEIGEINLVRSPNRKSAGKAVLVSDSENVTVK